MENITYLACNVDLWRITICGFLFLYYPHTCEFVNPFYHLWKTYLIHAKLILTYSVDNTVFGGIFLFDLDKFWQFFNAEMKKSYSTVAYNAWFKNTKPISFNKKD